MLAKKLIVKDNRSMYSCNYLFPQLSAVQSVIYNTKKIFNTIYRFIVMHYEKTIKIAVSIVSWSHQFEFIVTSYIVPCLKVELDSTLENFPSEDHVLWFCD